MATYSPSPALPRTRRPAALAPAHHATTLAAQAGLVLLMAIGSVALWAGSPLGWLWLASQVSDATNPGLGPYILLFAGITATSVLLARTLAELDRAYRKLSRRPQRRQHAAHLRASGQEKLERPDSGPLGIVMTLSVVLAAAGFAAWLITTGHPFVPTPW
jgi:hypothetical protein